MTLGAQGEWTITQPDGSRRNLTEEEKLRVVIVARELYDRFVMGGWEPQDSYPQLCELMFGTVYV